MDSSKANKARLAALSFLMKIQEERVIPGTTLDYICTQRSTTDAGTYGIKRGGGFTLVSITQQQLPHDRSAHTSAPTNKPDAERKTTRLTCPPSSLHHCRHMWRGVRPAGQGRAHITASTRHERAARGGENEPSLSHPRKCLHLEAPSPGIVEKARGCRVT